MHWKDQQRKHLNSTYPSCIHTAKAPSHRNLAITGTTEARLSAEMPSTAEKVACLTDLHSGFWIELTWKEKRYLWRRKRKAGDNKSANPPPYTHTRQIQNSSVTRLRNCPPPRICAYSSQDLHIFLSQCECRNPGHLSRSRINYT